MYTRNNGQEKRNRQAEPYPCGSKSLEQIISMDDCAKLIIDSALMKIQQQLLKKAKQGGPCMSNNPLLGFKRQDSSYERTGMTMGGTIPNFSPSKRGGGWQEAQYQESRKEDISSILTSTIQKVMREAVSNVDNNSNNMNRSLRQAPPPESKPQRIKATSKLPSGPLDMYGNTDRMNMLDIDQLVKSMTKLCLLETGSNGSNLGSGDTSHKQYNGSSQSLGGPRTAALVRSNVRQGGTNGIIVTNQNGENGSLNKELQAVLQWMVASHFNVPNLTFLNDREGELADLPQLAQKATQKGYSVGEILQKVMRYLERTEMEEAMGKRSQCGLIRWLHGNL